MERFIKLEFQRGGTFKAKMLDHLAPKTCRVVYDSLPFSSGALNGSFSGYVFYLEKGFDFHELENPVVFGAQPGDIFLNTNANRSVFEGKILPPRIVVAYSSSVILQNWAGYLPSNLFAKIVDADMEKFYQVGKRIRWEGREAITFSTL